MNKILVTIYVVSIDEEYDLLLPIGKKIKDPKLGSYFIQKP